MKCLPLLLFLLNGILASPAPKGHLSIFDDNSIPVVDQPDLGIFNLTILARDLGLEKRALTLNYILFDITFDGRNTINSQPFLVQGEMLITGGVPSPGTKNGVNPVEVVLSVGKPRTSAVAGSIQYVTNRCLYPFITSIKDTSRVDFAHVSSTSNTVTVSIDTSLAAANQMSVYNARSGVTAQIFNPTTGGFNINLLNNGQISGRINLVGVPLTSLGWTYYQANIGGKAKQKGAFTL